MSQKELAAQAGIPSIRMSRIERGEAEARVSDLTSIAQVLGVRVAFLIPDREENPLDRELMELQEELGVETPFFRTNSETEIWTIQQKKELRSMLREIKEELL